MSNNVRESLELKRKQESRNITKEIINFGVTQNQLYDIMFNLAMNIENHENMQEITGFLKKYIQKFNNDEGTDNNIEEKKILLS
tara:strand:+ start:4258 stop:4509 length:252 start_codon:yes stop_codon:yes gene_type:complete